MDNKFALLGSKNRKMGAACIKLLSNYLFKLIGQLVLNSWASLLWWFN
jgi:hypothetical protein